jgi:hemerythrin superfamily protein
MATNVTDTHAANAKPSSRTARGRSSSGGRSSNGRGGRISLADHPVAFGAAAAAVGVMAGLAATVGRKVAVQGLAAMSGDWFEELKAEHKAVLAMFDKLEATSSAQTTKRSMLLTQIKHALSKHAFEEENVIYPALHDAGETEMADQLNHEHGTVKQYLYDLGNMPRDDSRWLPKVAELRRDLETHMTEEETRIFPAFKARMSAEQNGKLTTALNREGFKLA